MKRRKPRTASPDEVKIRRDGEYAIIEFADERVMGTHLKLGPEVQRMTDEQILDQYNDCVRAQEQARAEYEHVAIEVPPGKPQLRWFEKGHQWTPRGSVLRCVVHDGGGGDDNQAVIEIDDQELSLEEFGRMLTTHAGWGMRIVFVPDDELTEEPVIDVHDPIEGDEGAR